MYDFKCDIFHTHLKNITTRCVKENMQTNKQKTFVLRLEAQEGSRCVIAIVKMAILWSLRPRCTHREVLTNLISQDPSMGLV